MNTELRLFSLRQTWKKDTKKKKTKKKNTTVSAHEGKNDEFKTKTNPWLKTTSRSLFLMG